MRFSCQLSKGESVTEVRLVCRPWYVKWRLRGWGPWGLVVGWLRMMSMSTLKRERAGCSDLNFWRSESTQGLTSSNVRSIKLEMKFVQVCCVAEAAVSKESFDVARSGCDTGA